MSAHRLVVGIVGTVLIVSVVFMGLLALRGMAIPDPLQNVAVGSLTGLLGILVTPARSSPGP